MNELVAYCLMVVSRKPKLLKRVRSVGHLGPVIAEALLLMREDNPPKDKEEECPEQ